MRGFVPAAGRRLAGFARRRMRSRDSRSVYERRMHKVLDHIDRQLDKPLELATLAEVAHFSPFHFHRLFAAWMGETLGDYLRRRRVEVAAMRLSSQPRLSVLTVAISVGFGSGEAFARAFKVRFGCSPTAWREENAHRQGVDRNPDQVNSNHNQVILQRQLQHGVSRNPKPGTPMKVALVDRAPAFVAYQRHTGPYGEPLFLFWQQTMYPWLQEHSLLGQSRYGLSPRCHRTSRRRGVF